MAVIEMSPIKYGKLLAKALPKVIETREEFNRYITMMEELDKRAESGKTLTPEEETLLTLLERLVEDYEDRIELPSVPPHKVIALLMDKRGLRQTDLLPVFGTRSVASDVVNGRRALSKTHIRKLSAFFKLPADVFF